MWFNRLWWKFFCVLCIIACDHYHLMHFEWLTSAFDFCLWIWLYVCICIMTALIHLYDCKHYLSSCYDISLQYVVTNLCISLNWLRTCLTTAIGSDATIDAFDAKDAKAAADFVDGDQRRLYQTHCRLLFIFTTHMWMHDACINTA